MKIKLSTEQGVEILSADDTKTVRDFQIIKAGIKKFFLSGKNKIVIELPNAKVLDQDALRELAQFDLMARELAGRITIAGVSPELRAKIEQFSAPPVIPIYPTLKEAVESFKTAKIPPNSDNTTGPLIPKTEAAKLAADTAAAPAPTAAAVTAPTPAPQPAPAAAPVAPTPVAAAPTPAPAPKPAPPVAASAPVPTAPAPTAPAASTAAAHSADHAPVTRTRDEIMASEQGEIGKLKKHIAVLENVQKVLEEQVLSLAIARQAPTTDTAYKEQIKTLEAEKKAFFDEIEHLKGTPKT